ncbi:MAG: hypothetical protein M1826_006423 [Phylliscum demangeonii]|nr:MAG: hypothetical protein M1826_006423 [Phylliscum demangeonii]
MGMGTGIDALYIINRHHTPILQHVYRSRPPPAERLLPLYLAHAAPRPSPLYLAHTQPACVVFSLLHGPSQLLVLATSSVDTEPLLVHEFLHRVLDSLEDFLLGGGGHGAPQLLESKIEHGYDVVAQLLDEMCDGGAVCTTEGNALRDLVHVPGWMGRWLAGVGLPGPAAPATTTRPVSLSSHHHHHHQPSQLSAPSFSSSFSSSSSSSTAVGAPGSVPQPLPWRRANVRHTSNELYVDVVEALSVIVAPSGRALAAFAHGSIVFTCKMSGVPDLLLSLTSAGGGGKSAGAGIDRLLELPVFHPCVRLARWRERPGQLSFVPPDGRFVLAGYEVDLLPALTAALSSSSSSSAAAAAAGHLPLPLALSLHTGLGPGAASFEVRLLISHHFFPSAASLSSSAASASSSTTSNGIGAGMAGGGGGGLKAGLGARLGSSALAGAPSAAPTPIVIEDIVVSVPIPGGVGGGVRTLADMHASRGEAHYNATDGVLEWRLPSSSSSSGSGGGGAAATLRCTVVGHASHDEDDEDDEEDGEHGVAKHDDDDDENDDDAINGATPTRPRPRPRKKAAATAMPMPMPVPMPSAATLSFSIRGWLASGLKVDSLTVNGRASRGVAEAVKPYKGVKYLTVCRREGDDEWGGGGGGGGGGGWEVRC